MMQSYAVGRADEYAISDVYTTEPFTDLEKASLAAEKMSMDNPGVVFLVYAAVLAFRSTKPVVQCKAVTVTDRDRGTLSF